MEEHDCENREIFLKKDKAYGGSWQKRGIVGAFLNLERKWDRINNMFENGTFFEFNDGQEVSESIIDTLRDLENYSKMIQWLMEEKMKIAQGQTNSDLPLSLDKNAAEKFKNKLEKV